VNCIDDGALANFRQSDPVEFSKASIGLDAKKNWTNSEIVSAFKKEPAGTDGVTLQEDDIVVWRHGNQILLPEL
jgi:hypothetical protein